MASTSRPANPTLSELLRHPEHLLAFGFGSGLAPKGPGTAGSLLALPFVQLSLSLGRLWYVALWAALFAVGCWVCGRSARRLGVHDHPGIVFDEFVGLAITAGPLLWMDRPAWPGLLLAFVAFRVFDIAKPWPISWLDRRVHGGLGIMLDDAVAGVAAAVVLGVALAAWPAG